MRAEQVVPYPAEVGVRLWRVGAKLADGAVHVGDAPPIIQQVKHFLLQ
jgi:hypothetical protein